MQFSSIGRSDLRFYTFLIAFTVAVFLGLGSAWIALERGWGLEKRTQGVWYSYPDRSAPDAGPYARAQLAVEGRLVPGRAEGIVFYADTDTDGQSLRRQCAYGIEGQFPQARLWSLHAQDEAGLIIRTAHMSPTLVSDNVAFSGNGTVSLVVSPRIAPGNWLGISGEGAMRLVLTLFDTPASANFGLSQSSMPRIERGACGDKS